jgi:fluoroquinolone transport system permease protein
MMQRLIATIRLDLRLQWQNGFYYAAAFVLLTWFVVLTQLPAGIDWGYLLPAVVFGNLVMVNFYFVAGLVLLEKGEGTLEAQVVTPLADWEYLVSKTVTLTALSLVEQGVIVWSAYGLGAGIGALAARIVSAGVLYTLTGFVLVARYDSINEFLFPSVLFIMILSLPMVYYFELWDTWLWYLHPFTAPMVLLKAAFTPIPLWQWAYGVSYSLVWAVLLLQFDQRVFARFIVAREGAH